MQLSAGVIAGISLNSKVLSAREVGNHGAEHFIDEMLPQNHLRNLASVAISSAKQAGASYADVRLSYEYTLNIFLLNNGSPATRIDATVSYGIRAMVNGAMAFNYGSVPTIDAIAQIARNAVTQARGFSKLFVEQTELAPAPVVTSEWSTPYKIDPFKVPILEQAYLLGSLRSPPGRVEGASPTGTGHSWVREIRVCATSEGSLTTQTFQRLQQNFGVGVGWVGHALLGMPDFRTRNAGYEVMLDKTFQERIKEFAEHVKVYAKLPTRQMDVGRYPIVVDGSSMAMILARTLGPALQLDRVIGLEADASGTSFLAPLDEVLNAPLFSPVLSVQASRPVEEISGAKWDDECVAPQSYPIIENGRVINYLSDRRTASIIDASHKAQQLPAFSGGYAVAGKADRPVMIGSGHLSVSAESSTASLEDLYKEIKRGVLMIQAKYVNSDQQLASGMIGDGDCLLLEIRDGRTVSIIKGVGLQFKTSTLWKGLDRVGSPETLDSISTILGKGLPRQTSFATASAPAGHFTSIDVISVGGT